MNFKIKLTALLLAVIICMGTAVFTTMAADTDTAELTAMTGLEPVSSQQYIAELSSSTDELPAKYNSKDYGWVLPVRRQQDNTCWAFGALSTFETLLLKNGEDIETFSPQHANIWGTKRADSTGWQRNEQNSGYSYIPLGYLTSQAGPVYESDFPETSTKEDYNSFQNLPEYVLTEAVFFNNSSSTDAVKELIYTYGSVVGNFNADNRFSSGASYYCSDHSFKTSELIGHCISVVGWDDSYAKENFSGSMSGIPDNDGAWIIKNSWGQENGDNGYYYISYEDVWIFDQRFGYSYAFTDYEKLTDSNGIYQNEVDGATYECTYFTAKNANPCDTVTYMNVFDFSEDNRTLDKVVFETTSKGADYTIHYIPLEDGVPTSDIARWATLCTGVADYTGYICADLEDTLIPAGKGAVGITIDNTRTYLENKDTPGYTYIANSIGVSEWLTSGGRLIFMPQSEFGMSYYMQNGEVRDLMDYYDKNLDDDVGGTFVIKALTVKETSTEVTTTTPAEIPTTVAPSTVPPTSAPAVSTVAPSTVPSTSAPAVSTVAPSTTNPDFTEPVSYIIGDADGNTKVNVKDATTIQKHAASLLTLTDTALWAADSTEDGIVNVKDATVIQKYIAYIETNAQIGKIVYYFG